MPEPDELDDIAAEAAELGVAGPLPAVRRITADGPHGEVSALRWGTGPIRVVLLHGAGLNAHTWDATVLSWGIPALAVDLPGHGRSRWRADGDYRPSTLAVALAPVLRQWVEEGVLAASTVLVGQSLGGLTAVHLAQVAEEVRHVVLVDILPLPPGSAADVAQFLAGPTRFDSRAEIVERALAFGLGGNPVRLERAVRLNTRLEPDGSVVWRHDLATLGPVALPVTDPELGWAALADVGARLDLVRGSRGLVDDALVARLAVERPASRVLTLDAGHNIQEDAPTDLARALGELIDDVS